MVLLADFGVFFYLDVRPVMGFPVPGQPGDPCKCASGEGEDSAAGLVSGKAPARATDKPLSRNRCQDSGTLPLSHQATF